MEQEKRRLYWVWADMLSRCRNKNHQAYKNYGGRGIGVCNRWLVFSAFHADMAPRPKGKMIDRKNNDGPYSPDNCRWVTRKQQNSNRRNCIYVSCDGETVTLREYCRRKSMSYRAICKRIQDRGWPIELALTAPSGTRRARCLTNS